MLEEPCSKAVRNALSSLHQDFTFPDSIFVGGGWTFLFFEADFIFLGEFMKVISDLMRIEGSTRVCMINWDEYFRSDQGGESVECLTLESTPLDYSELLKRNRNGVNWLALPLRFVLASNVGSWTIFCDRAFEIAAIGIRDQARVDEYRASMQAVFAAEIEELTAQDCELSGLEISDTLRSWGAEGMRNYGRHRRAASN